MLIARPIPLPLAGAEPLLDDHPDGLSIRGGHNQRRPRRRQRKAARCAALFIYPAYSLTG